MQAKKEINSSSLNVARQPSGEAEAVPLGGRGAVTDTRSDNADVRGWRYWQEHRHAFVGAEADQGPALCKACFLPRSHALHRDAKRSVPPAVAGGSSEISDRRLTCAACNQLVKAGDDGMLGYHEVGVPCPLPKTLDRLCVLCLDDYAGGFYLHPCQGSYTKGHPHRMLPEAVSEPRAVATGSEVPRGFTYLRIEDAPKDETFTKRLPSFSHSEKNKFPLGTSTIETAGPVVCCCITTASAVVIIRLLLFELRFARAEVQ